MIVNIVRKENKTLNMPLTTITDDSNGQTVWQFQFSIKLENLEIDRKIAIVVLQQNADSIRSTSTIGYVFIGIQSHILFAVNLDEFRDLANKYLSEDLAAKLSNLVSASATRRDRDAKKIPDIDLNWVADLVKDKLLNPLDPKYATKEKHDNVKRFSTVKQINDEHELRHSEFEQTSPGLVYTRDEIDHLLQNNEGMAIDDNTEKPDYSETRPKQSDEFAVFKELGKIKDSFEAIKGTHKVNRIDKRIDYTETKLGEWLYNQIISRKPIKMINQKEPNTDISDSKDTNIKNPQYVYETRLGEKDKNYNNKNLPALKPDKDTKEVYIHDHDSKEPVTINIMGAKTKANHNKLFSTHPIEDKYVDYQTKDQKLTSLQEEDRHESIKSIHESENKKSHDYFGYDHGEDIREVEPDFFQPIENKMILDTKLSNNQQKEEHDTYNKYLFGSKENDISKNKHEAHPLEEHGETGVQSYINNNKQGVDILASKNKYIFENDDKRHSVEEHDKYEKKELDQTNNSNNKHGVNNQQLEESEAKLIQETKKIFNDENDKDETDQSGHDGQLLLRNKKTNHKKIGQVKSPADKKKSKGNDDRIIFFDSPEVVKENSESLSAGSKRKKKRPKIQHSSEEPVDTDVKKEKSKSPSPYSKDKKKKSKNINSSDESKHEDKLELGRVNNEKENKNRKEKKMDPIEDNDMYEKYELGSHSKNKKDTIKSDHSHESKRVSPRSTTKYHHVYSNKPEINKSVLKSTHKTRESTTNVPTKHLKGLYKGVKLGSTEESTGSVEKSDEHLKERKKVNVNGRNTNHTKLPKKPMEENDMYEKFSLGAGPKSSNEKKVNKDDKHGHVETVNIERGHNHNIIRNKHEDDPRKHEDFQLKNKPQRISRSTKKMNEFRDKNPPLEGYADDHMADFKEEKPESIKAKTEKLGESVEVKGKATKKFMMKGTHIPKREFYKLSSPNYYKDLPRTVDKYDFNEPIPEMDRVREKEAYLKREPARVNKKHKLPEYEKVKYHN